MTQIKIPESTINISTQDTNALQGNKDNLFPFGWVLLLNQIPLN